MLFFINITRSPLKRVKNGVDDFIKGVRYMQEIITHLLVVVVGGTTGTRGVGVGAVVTRPSPPPIAAASLVTVVV